MQSHDLAKLLLKHPDAPIYIGWLEYIDCDSGTGYEEERTGKVHKVKKDHKKNKLIIVNESYYFGEDLE